MEHYVDPIPQGQGPTPLSVARVHLTPCAHLIVDGGQTIRELASRRRRPRHY